MATDNNFSVLPFYGSIEEQNARKWWLYDKVYPLFTPARSLPPFQVMIPKNITYITQINILDTNGDIVAEDVEADMPGITIKSFEDYNIIVYPANEQTVITANLSGRYYISIQCGDRMYYSDVFTIVNDISGYLKLEWWNNADFVMDAGTIVYDNPEFRNVLYLCSDIAKPEYDFSDEVIERDGYTFPVVQISKKIYRFSFWASEYLLDVMRLIRMADNIVITKGGKTYDKIDSFLLTPDWEKEGDIASVDVEFTTDTVAKKTGNSYTIR